MTSLLLSVLPVRAVLLKPHNSVRAEHLGYTQQTEIEIKPAFIQNCAHEVHYFGSTLTRPSFLSPRPPFRLSDFSQPVSFENAEIGQCPNLAPPPPPPPALLPDVEEPEEEKGETKEPGSPLTPTLITPTPRAPAVSGSNERGRTHNFN